jgi:hypothetical protein
LLRGEFGRITGSIRQGELQVRLAFRLENVLVFNFHYRPSGKKLQDLVLILPLLEGYHYLEELREV